MRPHSVGIFFIYINNPLQLPRRPHTFVLTRMSMPESRNLFVFSQMNHIYLYYCRASVFSGG